MGEAFFYECLQLSQWGFVRKRAANIYPQRCFIIALCSDVVCIIRVEQCVFALSDQIEQVENNVIVSCCHFLKNKVIATILEILL